MPRRVLQQVREHLVQLHRVGGDLRAGRAASWPARAAPCRAAGASARRRPRPPRRRRSARGAGSGRRRGSARGPGCCRPAGSVGRSLPGSSAGDRAPGRRPSVADSSSRLVTPALIDASGVRRSCVTDENIAARSWLVSASSWARRARASSRARSSATAACRVAASSSSRSSPRERTGPARAARPCSVPSGIERHDDGHDLGGTARLQIAPRGRRRHRLAVERDLHACTRPVRTAPAAPRRTRRARGRARRPTAASSTGRPAAGPRAPAPVARSALVGGVAHHEPDHRGDREEHDRRDHVAQLLELQPEVGVLDHRQRSTRRAAPRPPRPRCRPLTAAIVTASMKIATADPGPRSRVKSASSAAHATCHEPDQDRAPRDAVDTGSPSFASTTAHTLPPRRRPFTVPKRPSHFLHAGRGFLHAALTPRCPTLARGKRFLAETGGGIVTPDDGPTREGAQQPLSSEPV